MSRTFPALAAALVAGSLCAQTVVIPSNFGQTGTFSVPGGTTQNFFTVAGVNRFQAVYDSTNFTSEHVGQPITITGLEFRMGNAIASPATTYPSVEIYLQNSAVDFNAVTTTFTNQRSIAFPTTPNFSGPVTQTAAAGTSPNSYVMNIPLTIPFSYSPEAGVDLLVEVVINGAPTPAVLVANTSFASSFAFPTHRARANRSPGSIVAATGTLSAFAPVIRFAYTSAPNSAKEEPYGVGCGVTARSYYEQFPGSANDLGGKTVSMAQNLAGGYDVTTTVGATMVTPTGVALTLGDDVVSASIPLPFTFDYPGGSTTAIRVDSNGSILLNAAGGGSSIGGSGAVLLASTSHRLAASMQDLLPTDALDPNSAGNVFAEADPANPTTKFIISWIGVPCFGAGQPSNFQIVLNDNGTADTAQFVYQNLRNNSTSNSGIAITGFSLGSGAVDGGSKDLTAGTVSSSIDRGRLTISSSGRPVINTAINITTSNIPASGVSLLFFSATQIPLGFDLSGIGMTGGCNAYITLPEFLSFLNLGTPTFVTNIPVPNDPLLVGAIAYAQAGALDPLFNAFGAVSSNGLLLEIGNN